MYPAVETTGRLTLLVRDNKVIGECCVIAMRGSDVAFVEMHNKAAKDLIANTQAAKVLRGIEWVHVSFYPTTGLYCGTNYVGPEADELNKIFERVMIVDNHHFLYGMCPDTFKNVPGYQSAFEEIERSLRSPIVN